MRCPRLAFLPSLVYRVEYDVLGCIDFFFFSSKYFDPSEFKKNGRNTLVGFQSKARELIFLHLVLKYFLFRFNDENGNSPASSWA